MTNQEPSQQNQKSTIDCAICYTEIQKNTSSCFTTQCDHTFCQDCITKWLLTNHNCPLCRTNLVSDNMTKFMPRTQTNHVDDDDDDDDDDDEDYNIMEDCPFEMNVLVPYVFDVPDSIMRSALLRAHNLTTILNHDDDDDDEEVIIPNLMTSWVARKPPWWRRAANGFEDQVFTTTLMHKGVKYAIYVETLTEEWQANVRFLAISNIRYVNVHIVPISFNTKFIENPFSKQKIKQSLKQQRRQTKYRIHRNTAHSKQRYTHH